MYETYTAQVRDFIEAGTKMARTWYNPGGATGKNQLDNNGGVCRCSTVVFCNKSAAFDTYKPGDTESDRISYKN